MKKLGDAELEIMLAVWGAGEPVPSAYVQEKLRGSRDWTLPAILTSLNRLVDKGFLACEKRGRGNWYRPLFFQKAKLYQGSVRVPLFLSGPEGLVGRGVRDDLAELRQYLDTLEGK